jgi:hypothetical protein
MNKYCNCCQENKDFSKFSKHPLGKFGLQSQCRDCVNLKKMERRKADPEKEYSKWRKAYHSNPEKYRKASLSRYEKNREHRNILNKEWRRLNKARISSRNHKKRAKRENALHPEHNPQIEIVLDEMKLRLEKCLRIKFEKDHILPISKGGFHHHANLQIIPKSLNRKKSSSLIYSHPILIHWTELDLSMF